MHGDASGVDCVSYSDVFFGVAGLGRTNRILAIELERLGEARPQAGKELLPSSFLTVDAGDFLDPSDPPVAILLRHRRVRIGQVIYLTRQITTSAFACLCTRFPLGSGGHL